MQLLASKHGELVLTYTFDFFFYPELIDTILTVTKMMKTCYSGTENNDNRALPVKVTSVIFFSYTI